MCVRVSMHVCMCVCVCVCVCVIILDNKNFKNDTAIRFLLYKEKDQIRRKKEENKKTKASV